MFIYALLSLLFLHLQPPPSSSVLVSAVNVSSIIHSSPSSPIEASPDESESGLSAVSLSDRIHAPRPSNFLKDVLLAIAVKQKWDLEELRVSNLKKARFAHFQRYEFRIRIGKTDLGFEYLEELDSWIRLAEEGDFKHLVNQVSSEAELSPFEVEGPAELIASAGDRIRLQLPNNTILSGLKRILVGKGITVQIIRAQEISLFHGLCGLINASPKENKEAIKFWPFENSFCIPLLPTHISGPASLIITCRRSEESNSPIKAYLSEEMIELNSAKCYPNQMPPGRISCPVNSLSSRIATMEKLLKRLLGDRTVHNHNHRSSSSLRAKVKTSTMVQFRLELEREVRNNDSLKKVDEWRTKPSSEHAWFDVMARLNDNGDRLLPIEVKNVRPFIVVDSAAWSNVLLNVSFTKFPALLVPSEPLTLDVKW